jgi:hypothetical protein
MPGALFVLVVAALVSWSVPTYVPGILRDLSGAEPVNVELQTDPAAIDTFSDLNQSAVVPGEGEVAGALEEDCWTFHETVTRAGGVPAGSTRLRLTLTGQEPDGLLISGMRARVLLRAGPLQGKRIGCLGTIGGLAEVRPIRINLDDPSPIARFDRGKGYAPLTFTLAEDEIEIFDISAATESCYCEWVLDIDLLVGGKRQTITVSDDGEPFRTTPFDATSAQSRRSSRAPSEPARSRTEDDPARGFSTVYGGRYNGTTSQRVPIRLWVPRDLRTIRAIRVPIRLRCSDGHSVRSTFRQGPNTQIRIRQKRGRIGGRRSVYPYIDIFAARIPVRSTLIADGDVTVRGMFGAGGGWEVTGTLRERARMKDGRTCVSPPVDFIAEPHER